MRSYAIMIMSILQAAKEAPGAKQGDEGKSYLGPENNLMLVITGLLLWMTSISLVSDSTSSCLFL